MTLYLLDILIYPKWEERRRGGAVNVARRYFSDVFSSIDKAVCAGAKMMTEGLEDLRKSMFKDKDIDEIANEEIEYEFIVFEFDPSVKRDPPERGLLSSLGTWSQYARWHYDYSGKLLYRVEKVEGLENGVRMPGDEKEVAGTLFKRDDFVKLGNNHPAMPVFLLNVSIIPVQRWTDITIVGPRDFSDVFLTIDEAVDAGQNLMTIWLEDISETYGDWPIEFLVGYWCLAEFKVYEFDPDVQRLENGLWDEYAEWEYNYKGQPQN